MSVRDEIKLKSRKAGLQDLLFKINVAVVLIGLVLASAVFLSRYHKLFISDITFVGNQATSSEELNATVGQLLSQNYLYIFPKKNFFITPKRNLGEAIIKQNLWVNNVAIEPVEFGKLLVTVKERKPDSVWCQSQEVSGCYFIDNTGFVFSPAPNFSDNVFIKIYGNQPADISPLGTYPVSRQKFRQISFIRQALPQIFESVEFTNVSVEKIVIESEQDISAYIDGRIGDRRIGWKILFDTKDDLQNVALNVSAAFKLDEFKEELEEKDWRLNYLDLRFGNKIFYTFEGDEVPEPVIETPDEMDFELTEISEE